ncbi:DUF11 domain-containing protein [Cryobacterium adonitolivorans]|uniref:DUF11 domain-containing protein n=1 Tax=Cryobacterium adonitolivorans TaxID=1259189 RepID=A0A4R8W1A2_9MICO|nr:DUF11 domain-containing protein [Cryobacterium adonitolivorans]TFB99565.1 DUF11 domain-containing protein [Cryobacterium adonitolivorans]
MPLPSARMRHRRPLFTRGFLAPTRRHMRVLAGAVASLLVAVGLTVGVFLSPAVADEFITLTATEATTVLHGEQVTISLEAQASSATDHFNLAFRYELPAGVSYAPGSSATNGSTVDPTVITITDTPAGPGVPAVTHQVLVWSNVADLPAGVAAPLSFAVVPDPVRYPVGSTIPGAAAVYAQSNPRLLVKFTATTGAASNFTASATATPTATKVAAIEVTKTEPSPEHELMRGVQHQATVYTIATRNTTIAPTDNVVLVDYLPAGLEFLGCGATDNSAQATEEYPSSGRLDQTAAVPADCVVAESVETVTDRPDFIGQVFTKVTWNLGTLAAGATVTVNYAAGIPLLANERWAAGTAPDSSSGLQGANLDNNTGASTRQEDAANAGQALTNTATASGRYSGLVATEADRATTSSDSVTVRAMDLSIVKTGTSGFGAGKVATFSLLLRAGEYTDDSAMTIVDVIPNGLCPMLPASVVFTRSAGCADGVVTGATVDSAVANADGTFTVTMTPAPTALAHDTSLTISYDAYMGANYEGTTSTGTGTGVPTAAGDGFLNVVSITGTTAGRTPGEGAKAVTDDSEAGLDSSGPVINKKVLPRPTGGTAVDCEASAGNYTDSDTPTYQLGDTVCFELTVAFSTSSKTRNAQITDFVPVGTTFAGFDDDGGVTVTPVAGTQAATPTDANAFPAAWALGDVGSGGDRFVPQGAVLTLYVSATVTGQSTGTEVDITANLMKYRQNSTDGTVLALRDQVDFGIAPAPVLTLDKAVALVNGVAPAAPNDSVLVREGNLVTFSVDIANKPFAATNNNNVPVADIAVWDALPADYTCTGWTVASISNSGTCVNPGDPGYPATLGSDPRSVIVWTVPGPLAAGASTGVSYSITVPQNVSVTSKFTNTASVVAFTSPNTSGGDTTFFPKGSLDPSHNVDGTAPPANDTAEVHLPDTLVAKTGVTNIVASNNDLNSQVVAGETVDYTFSVTVPAGSTVFDGVLSDPMVAGLTKPATGATYSPVTAGFSLDSATGALTFPSTYDNVSALDQTFTVTVPGVLVGVGLSSGTLTNTARFASNATPAGTAVAPRTATKTVTVVAPAPTLAKSVDKPTARGGELVTFTLTAGNAAGRPAAFDSVITDCLPGGLLFTPGTGFLTSPAGTVTASAAGTGANGCASGTTKLTWTLPASGALLNPAVTTVTFGAVVDPDSAGLVKYINTAFVTGSTLDNDPGQNVTPVNDSATELVVAATSSATVTVEGAVTVKTVQPASATIGGTVDYTVSVALPLNVQFYDAAIIDTLPAGIRPGSATVTCLTAQGVSCAGDLPGNGAQLTASGQKIGWVLGDVLASSENRTITVTFSATVLAGTAGDILKNSAFLGWNRANGANPTAADATFDETAASPTADVTVLEPRLTIGKAASDTTPEPGQVITYTVTTRNGSTATTSDAFDVSVVDTIPSGIDLASIANISGGGVLSGNTITWTVATIAKGGSDVQTFQARLAASSTLGTGAIVNRVSVPTYRSLPTAATDEREYTANPPTATAPVTPAFPNVTVAKAAANGSTGYLNTDFGWMLTLRNTGTGTAKTVTPTDVLPRNWVYTAGTGTVKIGAAAAVTLADPVLSTAGGVQTLVWAPLTAVAPGTVIVIRFSAQPTTAAATTPGSGAGVQHRNTLTATATDATDASGRSGPTSYAPGTATADAFIQSADVRIAKAAGDPLLAGTTTPRAWTLTVRNAGPDTAVGSLGGRNFVVTDLPAQPLPAGITVTAASGTGWTCTAPNVTTGAFDCERSNANETLANGVAWPAIVVAVAVASTVADATTVTNSAGVAARTYDPTPANNTSEATIAVTTSADLAVTKTAQGTFAAGQQASWHLDVVNLGPSNSAGPITVTDTLPGNISNVVVTGADATCAVTGGTVTCTLNGALALNATTRIVVTALVDSGFTGSLTNTATVSGTTTDPVPVNNDSETATPVDTTTSLGINKSLVEPTLVPGTTATYRFVVTNTGFADARTVAIEDVLPNDLTYAGPGAAGPGTWACSETSPAPATIGCALTGTLVAGGTETVDVLVNVPSSLTGNVRNSATVSSANTVPATGTTDTALTGESDLGITKSHPTGEVLAGTNVDYALTVTNFGPSDAPFGSVVVDHVPVGLVPVSATGSGWNCAAPVGQDVTCTSAGILDAGATADPITVLVSIPAGVGAATFTNVATVVGVLPEPADNRNPNRAEDPTVVTTLAEVTIVKAIAPIATEVVAGTSISYTLTVTKTGPSNAEGLTVADLLPAGFTAVAISGDGWTCTMATVSCARATLGDTASVITVTAAVSSAILDTTVATNTATVGWTDSRPTPHSDSDTVPVTVVALVDLELTKSTPSANVMAGSDIVFDLVLVNDGPSDAVGAITLVDTLPAGIRWQANTPDWSCLADAVPDTDPQPVTCTLGDGSVGLGAGGTATALTITTSSDPALGVVTLTNTATVSTPSTETTLANNTGEATVTLGQSAELGILKSHAGAGRIGTNTAFRLVVTNDGPSTASGITVLDTLPRGLGFVDAAGSDPLWSCVAAATDPAAGTTPVTCSLATDLGPRQIAPELVVNASVGALAYPSVENVAAVSAVTPDPEADNNTASDALVVDPLVSLGLTKTHVGDARAGQQLDYLITVTNSGPTENPGTFTIVDVLPDSVTYVGSTGKNVNCLLARQTVTCVFAGPLAVGESRTVTLTVKLHQSAPPQVAGTVTAESPSVDTAQTPITASDTAKVRAAQTIFGLAQTGVDALMLFIGVTIAILALILGAGLLWRDRHRRVLRNVR